MSPARSRFWCPGLVATALSAAESADDERVLHTVGAAPALLRTHAAAHAGYLALLGCLGERTHPVGAR